MKVETNPDHVKARAFFRRVLSLANAEPEARLAAVVHLVDSAIPFIPTLNERYPVQAILGKPSSIQRSARDYLRTAVPDREFVLDKDAFRKDPEQIIREAFPPVLDGAGPVPVVLLDIGGYFVSAEDGPARGLLRIAGELANRGYELRGVVEDTENGHKRYESAAAELPPECGFAIFSVARSPLKRPENHLVGVAVTFSIEALLRKSNIVLQSRRAGVIGFGPIGRSVAHSLRNRGIPVSVCEIDPIQLASAAAQGFRVFDYRHHFEDFARDLNLVVSATGAGADRDAGRRPLDGHHVRLLQGGTFVASVTSCDDEIDILSVAEAGYKSQKSYNPDVHRWIDVTAPDYDRHFFYLMLEGNAVNFKHEGVIGPAIQLLQGEIAACVSKLLDGEQRDPGRVHVLSECERREVADIWLDQYLADSSLVE